MNPEHTIRTGAAGRRAAAIRDGVAEVDESQVFARKPAPWTAHADRGFSWVEAANGLEVAGDLHESDVHLIAAAPELLALCRDAAVLIAGIPDANDGARLMVARLNEAIAKAERRGCTRCGGTGKVRLLDTHEMAACTHCERT